MVQFLARMVVAAKMKNATVRLSTEELSVMEVSSCCCTIVRFLVIVFVIFVKKNAINANFFKKSK